MEPEPRAVCTLRGVGKVLPDGRAVLRDLWLSLPAGGRIGVLGGDGDGRSTLLRILAGEITDFAGEASPAAGVTVGYLPPAPRLDAAQTVAGAVEEGVAPARDLLKRYDAVTASLSSGLTDYGPAMEEQGRLQNALDAAGAWDLDARVRAAKAALALPPGPTPAASLGAAEQGRVVLCRLLLQAPGLLLLDEPTRHLDARAAAWLEQFLARYRGTVVAATSDRCLLHNVADWILELDGGAGVPWQGNYGSWLEQKQRGLALEGRPEAPGRRALQRELEWVRLSPRARQAQAGARLDARRRLLGGAGEPGGGPGLGAGPGPGAASGRGSDPGPRGDPGQGVGLRPGIEAGEAVVETAGLRMARGGRLLFDGLSFTLPPAAVAAVVGPPGAGKTTLLRLIAGELQPDAGALRLGEGVRVGALSAGAPGDESGGESGGAPAGAPGGEPARQPGADPGRAPGHQPGGAPGRALGGAPAGAPGRESGGEPAGAPGGAPGRESGAEPGREPLAALLRGGADLLLLDEPADGLDVDALRALEDALAAFAGSAVVVSRDRWFLDRVATHVLALEAPGRALWFAGDYSSYEAARRRRSGAAARR